MKKHQQKLATIWLIGAGVTAILLFFQMAVGRYDGFQKEVFSWFLPNVMPTLLLIIGVLVKPGVAKAAAPAPASFLFKVTVGLSVVYLFLVLATVIIQPYTNTPALELMRNSNFLLGPLQGLTAAALGVFFAK